MRSLDYIFALYKLERGLNTDTEVARDLHVEATALSNYKNGKRRMTDEMIVWLAKVTGISIGDVLAAMNLNLEKTTSERRQFWFDQIGNDELIAAMTREAKPSKPHFTGTINSLQKIASL